MSRAADNIIQAEQEAALREAYIWHAGNVIKDALASGDEQAQQILTELEQIEKEQK